MVCWREFFFQDSECDVTTGMTFKSASPEYASWSNPKNMHNPVFYVSSTSSACPYLWCGILFTYVRPAKLFPETIHRKCSRAMWLDMASSPAQILNSD